jgi:Uri superfamily endonuclease
MQNEFFTELQLDRRHWPEREQLPTQVGAYVLELHFGRPLWIQLGAFSQQRPVRFEAGRYRYYGSAHGPGGLRGRVFRHLQRAKTRRSQNAHWHIDALLSSQARLVRIELWPLQPGEHALVARDLARGWQVTLEGFGASDCRQCPAHLLCRVP